MGIPLKHGFKGWCHSLGVFAATLPPPPPPPQNKDEHTMLHQIALYIMPWPDPQARLFCEPTKY